MQLGRNSRFLLNVFHFFFSQFFDSFIFDHYFSTQINMVVLWSAAAAASAAHVESNIISLNQSDYSQSNQTQNDAK